MKGLSLYMLLPLAAATPLNRRQHSHDDLPKAKESSSAMGDKFGQIPQNPSALGSILEMISPPKRAMKIEELKPQFANVRKDVKRVKLTYGPYKLKAANSTERVGNSRSMDPFGTSYSYMAADDFPRDVTILRTYSEAVDEHGKKVDVIDGLYNHHNVFFDFSANPKAMVSCDGKTPKGVITANVFIGGATEEGDEKYTSEDGKFNSGFYIGKKDKINMGLDIVNYNNQTRTIYIHADIEYIPGKVEGALSSAQQVINLGMCSGFDGVNIHPPAGKSKFKLEGNDIIIAQDGWMISTRGHLHDGGLNMVATINGKEICNSEVLYGGEGHMSPGKDGKLRPTIRTTTVCGNPIRVSKGDKMHIVANYDLEEHPAREQKGSMMGSMGGNAGGGHEDGAEQMALLIVTFAPTT